MAVSSFPGAYDPRYPYYNPSGTYGYQPGMSTWEDDPMNAHYIYGEQNPDAPWTAELANRGYSPNTTKGMWADAQQNKLYSGFQAAKLKNLNYTWQEHLKTFGPSLDRMWNEASPGQRGADDRQASMRWQMRP